MEGSQQCTCVQVYFISKNITYKQQQQYKETKLNSLIVFFWRPREVFH